MTAVSAAYDGFVRTTGDELWDRLHQAHRRFAALLTVTPGRTTIRGSDWDAAMVAGHVLTVLQRFSRRDLSNPEGLCADFADVARLNDDELAALGRLDVPEILDRTWQELADIEAGIPRTADLHQAYPFHGGVQIDAAAILGTLLGEFQVHGRDVARARGARWKIGSRNAALMMNVAVQVAPGIVAPDGPGDLALEIRTPQTTPWILAVSDGRATSRPSGRGEVVDVRIYGRPEALVLNQYGRIGIVQATARGVTVVGGRRPWRIVRLPATFLTP